jgi:hypothetical protein
MMALVLLIVTDRLMNRKKILRELLPLLLPVSSGVHSIIIDGYLDIQAAIRAKYIEIIQAEFKRKLEAPQPRVACLAHNENCTCSHWRRALDRPEQFNRAFAVFDEEPGYIDRAIWIVYDFWTEPTEGLFYQNGGCVSLSTLQQAIRACFPDAQFDGITPSSHAHHCSQPLSNRAANCRSLQVYFHYARSVFVDVSNIYRSELTIYKKSGTKPELFKPPLTVLGRLQTRYYKWTEQPNNIEHQETQYAVFWTAILSLGLFYAFLLFSADSREQQIGGGGALCCWIPLMCILLYEAAKSWPFAGKCSRLAWVAACITAVSCIIRTVLTLRELQVNPNVHPEFEWVAKLKSLFN